MNNVQEREQDVNSATMVAELDDDELATMSETFAAEAERLGRLSRGAFVELKARMLEREATKLDTEHWTGTIKAGTIHHAVDDLPRFHKRLLFLKQDELEAVFVQPPAPPMRIDMRQVNELYKRGGEVAQIIDEERSSVRGEGRLELERKSEAE